MIKNFSEQSQKIVEVRQVTRKLQSKTLTTSKWSLPLILAFQAVVSWLLLQNTAFQDEALYIYAGRQIVQHWLGAPAILDNYSNYFSGNPYVFPIIGGMLDMIGGLELVRFFSLICMLIVTSCGYYITKRLFDEKSAIFATIFFVCQAPILFLSRLATYDPLCLCLIALGVATVVKSGQAKRPWFALIVGPVLVLAFFAKYGALLFIPPILALLVLVTLFRWGWRTALIRGSLGIASFIISVGLALFIVIHYNPSMFHALSATTTNRQTEYVYSRVALVENILQLTGVSFLIGMTSLLFVRRKELLIAFLLLGSSLLVPTYHVYKAELTSLDKHLGFSMFFVMPMAGYVLAHLSGFRQRILSYGRYLLSGLAICLMLFLVLTPQATFMFLSWPPTTNLTDVLKTQVRQGNGHYLAEQFEVCRYTLESETYNWQWVGLQFFQYTDKQGHYYFGDPAYVKAINDGYFNVIQLNYGYNTSNAVVITNAIAQSNKYDLIEKVPYKDVYGIGYFWIWRLR
ncbi:MAG: DUF3824 domain-containing protein [Ktedonobacteraceae bacterium]